MITNVKNNNLNFEDDNRGFLACVENIQNVLGVCCTDLGVILEGRRPVRQDDVFQVNTICYNTESDDFYHRYFV